MRKNFAWINNVNVESVGPIAAFSLVHSPRVALVFHGAECITEFGGEVAFHQREVTTHVENLVENFNVYWTNFITSLA